jgi:hypothetical protein
MPAFTGEAASVKGAIMMRWLVCAALLCVAGCQTPMITVVALENQDAAQPIEQSTTVKEKGTYYLYSSQDPKTVIQEVELKKGDELGFRVTGNRARAFAKGILVELPEYSEGASYYWKVEEKKK